MYKIQKVFAKLNRTQLHSSLKAICGRIMTHPQIHTHTHTHIRTHTYAHTHAHTYTHRPQEGTHMCCTFMGNNYSAKTCHAYDVAKTSFAEK